jgi:hypothetical protein
LGDRPVPDRHERRHRPAGQPLPRGRPARPVLAAGSDLQPPAAFLRLSPEQLASTDRARADRLRDAVQQRSAHDECHPIIQRLNLAKRDAVGCPYAHPHSHTDPDTYPDPHAYTDTYPHPHAHAHPYTDANAHPNAYANTHPDAYANTHAHAYTDANANAYTDADTHPDAHAHPCICHHERI